MRARPSTEDPHGRRARTPSQIPARGWKDILLRVKDEFIADRVTLIAAGSAFYLLLAIFPAIAALVSIYGLVADPRTLESHLATLSGVIPPNGMELLRSQLVSFASKGGGTLGFAFLFGLVFMLWSANNGMKTLFEAMNVAYDETEKRGFVALTLTTLATTLGALVFAVVLVFAIGVVPLVLAFVGLGSTTEALISLLRWPFLLVLAGAAIAFLYRFGPSRNRAEWKWVTWGGVLATVTWVIVSILFSWYLQNFADYNATYGSLGAVIGLMMWLWISCVVLIFGAELNSEMEHQTEQDTTVGPEKPMGRRGAVMADTVGKAAGEERDRS